MDYYIIVTKKSSISIFKNSVEHIEGYGVYTETRDGTNYYDPYTKDEFFTKHYQASNIYHSWNTGVGGKNDPKATSKLERKTSSAGHDFMQSVADQYKKDNLLELPDMK